MSMSLSRLPLLCGASVAIRAGVACIAAVEAYQATWVVLVLVLVMFFPSSAQVVIPAVRLLSA
jgi:hypothetical protein